MITYVYFVRFRVVKGDSGLLDKSSEGSVILRRKKFVSTNKDLEDVEQYIERYVESNVERVEILVLSHLHGLHDI